jgi:DNA-binding HxlR family transcriptional regulator
MPEDRTVSYGWLKANRCRRLVVMAMEEDELSPTQIVKRSRKYNGFISLSTLNRVLKELMQAGVVRCIDASMYRGRPYSLTPLGQAFRERLLADEDYGLGAIRKEASYDTP